MTARRAADALPFLQRLDAIGWDLPLAAADFEPLASDARYRELAARIAARAPRAQRSAVAFSVPITDKRTIIAIDPAGTSRPFVPARHGGLLGVTGIKVDAVRGVLWAASHASRSMEGYPTARSPPGPHDRGERPLPGRPAIDGGDIT